jgi:hypothetical protein
MAFTSRRIRQIVGAVAVVVVLMLSGLAVRSVLRARARLNEATTARRARVAPDPPRLDARRRNPVAVQPEPLDSLPLAASIGAAGSDPLSFARTTAAEYRQRARYPSWSQPIVGAEDPLTLEEETVPAPSREGSGATLTGKYRDTTEGGDLAIDAEVDVTVVGRFHLEATLYSRDGLQPIAWAQHTAELPTGRQWMRLRFYGLILHERALDGPYLLHAVALSTLTQVPAVKNPLVTNAYVSGTYAAKSFSDRPFDDPDLLEAADRIEQVIKGLGPENDG